MGRGGGWVVSVQAFNSNDPSTKSRRSLQFFSVKLLAEKNENKQKKAGVGPFKKMSTHMSTKNEGKILFMVNVTYDQEEIF